MSKSAKIKECFTQHWKEALSMILVVSFTILTTILPTYYSLADSISTQNQQIQQLTLNLNLAQQAVQNLQMMILNDQNTINSILQSINITELRIINSNVLATNGIFQTSLLGFYNSFNMTIYRTTSNSYYLYAWNTINQALPFGASTIVNFDTIKISNLITIQAGVITIPAPGEYYLHAKVGVTIPQANYAISMGFVINYPTCDTPVLGFNKVEGTEFQSSYIMLETTIIYGFQQGDTVQVCIQPSNSLSMPSSTQPLFGENEFTVYKI